MIKKFARLAVFFILTLSITLSANVTGGKSSDVLLQGFHWNCWNCQSPDWYGIIDQNSSRIKKSGFTAVWFPPASQSTSWAPWGYEPDQLYNFNNAYGTESELKNCINDLDNENIKCIADVVINHRHAEGTVFTNPSWPAGYICSNAKNPGTGNADTGTTVDFAEDLDHTNPELQKAIEEYLNDHLKKLGFVGWRYDMVKGYAPQYTSIYNNATNPEYSIGENFDWTASTVEDWIDASNSPAFDFPLRNVLLEAVKNGHYSWLSDGNGGISGYTLIGTHPDRQNYNNNSNYYTDRAVTFLENHDTEEARNGNYAQPFPDGDMSIMGYTFILTHPGIPCIYWSDIYDRGSAVETAINKLISIRKDYQINSQSRVEVQKADDNDCFADYVYGNNGTIAMKIGPGDWCPSEKGFALLTSGNNYAVWGSRTNI